MIEKDIDLIPLDKTHFPLFYKWWNNQELRELTSQTFKEISPEEINNILDSHFENKNAFDFIITYQNKPIGHILIQKKKGKKFFEIYIAIGEKNYWNKGIGTISTQKACGWFFIQFPQEKTIELGVNLDNPRAIRCYEKVGFKKIRIKHYKNYPDIYLMHLTKK